MKTRIGNIWFITNTRDDRAAHLVRGTVDPVVQIQDSEK